MRNAAPLYYAYPAKRFLSITFAEYRLISRVSRSTDRDDQCLDGERQKSLRIIVLFAQTSTNKETKEKVSVSENTETSNQSSAYVRRHTPEEFSPQCLKPTVKYPTKVTVWGCMSSHGVGRLHIVSGIVKSMDYIEILQNKLLLTARDLFGSQSWVLQDDNAPCHRAKIVQKWLKDHTENRMN
ncbi:hypothetical protein TNCV_3507691 [Trichonephila clavipes]|uniref:Transposase n=1 Tax=Trichonephila clavipes TaxID=2585209 RepID=A0A8X6VCY5_TRICX|nr:hypothetical protein TNCV_3507691 [Trichonephila clavipes]